MRLLVLAAAFLSLTLLAEDVPLQTNLVSGLAITNLIQHKQEFQGKRVELKGYYWTGPESSQISDGRDRGPTKNSLWVAYYRVKPGCEEKVKWAKKGMVRILGRLNFRRDAGSSYPGPWPGEITDLEIFETVE